MTADRSKPPRSIAGFFTLGRGARVLSPVHTGSRFPEAVELHEVVHQNLAVNNMTDGIGRIFSLILDLGKRELGFRHKWRITSLLKTIGRQTRFTHEVIANYYTMLIVANKDLERAREMRRELPSDYEALVASGERAFGSIFDSRTLEKLHSILWVAPWVAIAALNMRYDPQTFRFTSLKQGTRFLRENSPDERFEQVLDVLRPHWDSTGLLSDLIANWDCTGAPEFQARVFERLRAGLPGLRFQSMLETPRFMREIFEAVEPEAARFGYEFFDILRKMAQAPDAEKVSDFYGASVSLPGLEDSHPRDLTMVQVKYAWVAPLALVEVLVACRTQGLCLLLLVMRRAPPSPEKTALLMGYCADERGRLTGPSPFKTTLALEDLVEILATEEPGHIIVKIDERDAELRTELANVRHPVFVLFANTMFGHIIEVLQELAIGSDLDVFYFELKKEIDYAAVVIKPRDKFICFMAPATRMGLNAIHDEILKSDRIQLRQTAKDLSAFVPCVSPVFTVVRHSYLGISTENEAAVPTENLIRDGVTDGIG